MDGVELVRKGVVEHLTAVEGGKKIIDFIRYVKNAGVKLHICKAALPDFDMGKDSGLIEEVDSVDGCGVMAGLILSCDKIFKFLGG